MTQGREERHGETSWNKERNRQGRENPRNESERKTKCSKSRDSDCLAGDMIILSVSVFKENVASDLNEKERMPEGERRSLC